MRPNKEALNKMLDVILAFYSKKDYYDLLNVILTKMMELTNADGGTLYVVEDGKLHFKIMRTISLNIFQGATDKIDLPPVSLDKDNIRNISAYAAIKNEIVNIADVYKYRSADFNFDGPKNYDKITGYRTCSMLVFPLTTTTEDGEEVIGVIQLINSIDEKTGKIRPFDNLACDQSFLHALSNIAANALSNSQHAKEIKEMLNSFVRVTAKAIDERSPYSVNHTNNVAKNCNDFAEYLGSHFSKDSEYHFNEARRERLVLAAFLHDIGKIITPLEIMDKPTRLYRQLEIIEYKFQIKRYQVELERLRGKISEQQYRDSVNGLENAICLIRETNTAGFLTDDKLALIKELSNITYVDDAGNTVPILTEANMDALTIRAGTLTGNERKTMQEHASATARLLEGMSFNKYNQNVPVWAKSHHEMLDGSGYPLGLSGDQVAVETRIISIMDIYDALTANDRPYKKAMPPEKALGILSTMAEEGKLHTELVKLFIESGVWELASS